ncbi:Solute carrier family 30 (Zinc transporter) member 5, partial [Paragonimus kellicotti]
VGVVVLLVTVCLDAGFAAVSRSLVASIGGAKRWHALSSLVSLVILAPIFLLSQLYGMNSSVQQDPVLQHVDDSSSQVSNVTWSLVIWIVYIGICTVMDFYFTSLVSARLGSHSVTCLAKSSITLTAFVLWYVYLVLTLSSVRRCMSCF